jgi:hypothetical protein
VRATLPLLKPPRSDADTAAAAPPYGEMDPEEWQRFIFWMRDNGLITSRPAPSDVLTNEYLPGRVPE